MPCAQLLMWMTPSCCLLGWHARGGSVHPRPGPLLLVPLIQCPHTHQLLHPSRWDPSPRVRQLPLRFRRHLLLLARPQFMVSSLTLRHPSRPRMLVTRHSRMLRRSLPPSLPTQMTSRASSFHLLHMMLHPSLPLLPIPRLQPMLRLVPSLPRHPFPSRLVHHAGGPLPVALQGEALGSRLFAGPISRTWTERPHRLWPI